MLSFGKETLIPTNFPITSILSSPKKSKVPFSLSHISRNSRNRNRQVFHPSIFGRNLKMNSKAITGPKELYQKAPQVVAGYALGGRSALKSLLDIINVCLSSSNLEPPGYRSALPLSLRPSAEEVNDFKLEAVRLMKYGKPEDAVLLLRTAYNSCKEDPEPAYNLEMALVEILICQGKFKEASECNCLKDEQRLPSDDRFSLYKAIVCTMLDEKQKAKIWWSKYLKTVEGGFDPPAETV